MRILNRVILVLRSIKRGLFAIGRALTTRRAKRTALLFLVVWLAVFVISVGTQVSQHKSPQVVLYNQGMEQYRQALANGDTDMMDAAIKSFDTSLAAYKGESQGDFTQRIAYDSPSTELAALTQLHKAVMLLAEGEATQNKALISDAMQAFVESIKLNPGGPYTGVSEADAQRLNEEALVAKYDLELLLKKHPDAGKGPGKGDGKPQPGQPAPGNDPGNMPGHGDPNQL